MMHDKRICFLTQDSKYNHEEEQQEEDVNEWWEGLEDLTQVSDWMKETTSVVFTVKWTVSVSVLVSDQIA